MALATTMMLAPVAPVLHVIVPAQPAAVSVTEVPAHTVDDGLTVMVGATALLPTVTVTLPGALSHLPSTRHEAV